MARFLIDAQLPPMLAQFLRECGHIAEHVDDAGLRDANDHAIWDHADEARAVIITKDEDFALRKVASSLGPQIVWIRIGNCSNNALME